jgi:hypothetical protein
MKQKQIKARIARAHEELNRRMGQEPARARVRTIADGMQINIRPDPEATAPVLRMVVLFDNQLRITGFSLEPADDADPEESALAAFELGLRSVAPAEEGASRD